LPWSGLATPFHQAATSSACPVVLARQATQPLVGAATVLRSGNGTPVGEARAESGQILAGAHRCHPVFCLVSNG